jgi:hypothetical protein
MTRALRILTRVSALVLLVSFVCVGCASDEIDKGGSGQGVISGEISYDGPTHITRVAVAVFDRGDNPPVTPPIDMFYDPETPVATGIGFPVTYEMAGLSEGEVWIMAYGDVDPDDGPLPKGIDPASEWFGPYTISATAENITLDMDLADDRWAGIDQDTVSGYFDGTDEEVVGEVGDEIVPVGGKAAIHGTITYDGPETGKLFIVGFPTNPPVGPPTGMWYPVTDDASSFPIDYAYDSVKPGTHFTYAYIDADPGDGMKNTDIDPVSEIRELSFEAGEVYPLDFSLSLP